MRVASFEVISYALPFREPYVTARGTLERRESILLRVRNEDGIEGLGEAVPLSLRGDASTSQVARELDGWLSANPQLPDANEPPPISAPGRCALWSARVDLAGKVAGLSTIAMLPGADPQGAPQGAIHCNATLVADTPDGAARNAVAWADEGFETFKLKVGAGGDDPGQVRAVRDAIGPDPRLRVDANGAWSVAEAEKMLDEMAEHDIELAEQPVASLEEMAELRGRTSVPLAADESVTKAEDAARAQAIGACEIATVKLSKVGGGVPARQIEDHLKIYLSSALDGPVGIAAAAHLAHALGTGNLAHGLATQRLFSESIASVECELRDGNLYVPPGPGLGVEIDEAALERCRL